LKATRFVPPTDQTTPPATIGGPLAAFDRHATVKEGVAVLTRKEELLLSEEELVVAWKLRRVLGALEPAQALEMVVDRMRASKTNAEFLRMIQRANIS